jgi:hypothetical protein
MTANTTPDEKLPELDQSIFDGKPPEIVVACVDYDGLLKFGTDPDIRYTWASERWRGSEWIIKVEGTKYKRLTKLVRAAKAVGGDIIDPIVTARALSDEELKAFTEAYSNKHNIQLEPTPLAADWRDIESAPRDIRVLTYRKVEEVENHVWDNRIEAATLHTGWETWSTWPSYYQPTHWQPLPQPPAVGE